MGKTASHSSLKAQLANCRWIILYYIIPWRKWRAEAGQWGGGETCRRLFLLQQVQQMCLVCITSF